mmetsp:Transcript_12776/g.28220  ORF Transcript_12776/g.28220 Transcript_12776/m.28220 type:complete len:287 (+) Transcript_12776:167-1027(+)|eukprot:CAMPEP_0170621134 /NCGR_PEP_ID=MMETSP0224-20130122/28440_1 /TAXON_ID=285029 /ORGANISM="Togula jolla, Strain CCCM 725" /LENGTH=286 /DNA_ID=CAMNT_0010947375 /DNA_START=164 /DNA_END=1024 /DNA_ORIENTATION=+
MGSNSSSSSIPRKDEPVPDCSPAFGTLAEEALVPFSTEQYPFLQPVQSILQCGGVPVNELHRSASCSEDHLVDGGATSSTIGPRDSAFMKRWQTSKHDPEASGYVDFAAVYHAFLRDVVRGDLGEDMILYQRIPTLRVHLAGAPAIGRPHRDADYHHSAYELNYWLPLGDVAGTNSLWAESVRDRGDFHPFVASYGEAVRFYGNQAWHFTLRNTSERTRVSFDFRVMRFSDLRRAGVPVDYSRAPLSREEHRTRGRGGQFCLGGFYGLMGAAGEVPREQAEALCAG